MTVSVIIPAYNAEAFIGRAVASLIGQTQTGWEAIIVADDEQDYKKLLAGQGVSDPRLRFATTGKIASGPAIGRNIGLDMAKYGIVAHLDADDAWNETFLDAVLPIVAEHGVCTGKIYPIDQETGTAINGMNYMSADGPVALYDIANYAFAHAGLVIDRGRSRARWPETLRYGEDIIFWAMLLDDVPAFRYVSEAHYYCYVRNDSLSRSYAENNNTVQLAEKLGGLATWIDNNPDAIRNSKNRDFLHRWFTMRAELEGFFGYKIVEPEVFKTELERRHKALFGQP